MARRSRVLQVARGVKRRLQRVVSKTRDAGERVRATILLLYAEGRSSAEIAAAVRYDVSAVRKVRQRFEAIGEAAVGDGRRTARPRVIDEDSLEALRAILVATPAQIGSPRPTWTRELLVMALEETTGLSVSLSTMSRMLRRAGARHGMAKPIVLCHWPKARRQRRLREIRALVASAPQREAVLYSDEVDIHLNPRIGRDWMLPGQQRRVLTPGKNAKHYIAGALDARTGAIHWVEHGTKTTHLFLLMLERLVDAYPEAPKIHVILDNYVIHKTRTVEAWLRSDLGKRVRLHFLPPYCPDHNRIERLWRDLHANVTRNHRHTVLDALMDDVARWLNQAGPWPRRIRDAA